MRRGDVCFVYGQFKGISNHVRNSCVSAQEKKKKWREMRKKKFSPIKYGSFVKRPTSLALFAYVVFSKCCSLLLSLKTHTHTHSVCIRVIYNCYTSL